MTRELDATTEQRLARQLERLKGIEKSEIRMIEADRHRFRLKYRKRDFPKVSLTASTPVKDSKINDPTSLHDDHDDDDDDNGQSNNNTTEQSTKKFEEQDYEAVRSLIFTDAKVDLDKILCLHLLTVHVLDIDEAELYPLISQKNGQSRVVVAASEESENSPNDILPCYVVEIQRDDSLQFHSRSTAQRQQEDEDEEEEEVLQRPEGQLGYRQYSAAAAAAEGAFQSPRAMPAPSAAGKMPIVSSPLLYNNLLESHEQAASRRGNPRGSPSIEHLLKYVHTGRLLDKSSEKTAAEKLQRAQSSTYTQYKRLQRVCKKEKYFICSESPKLPVNECRRILICFNNQLKNFVQTVVEILRNVNVEKTNALLDMLKSRQVVAAKLSEMKDFIDSLQDFGFVSLPESFTCVPGYAIVDAHSHGNKFSGKQAVAETLILEARVSDFGNLIDDMRQSICDFLKKSNADTSSAESLSDDLVSMTSVPSQFSTVNQKSSRMSFSVRKSLEKIEPINETTTKSYEAIQQEFNEAASARLAKKNNMYTDPDRVILRRMTNSQRILVGQMCAALKTKKINREGMVKEKIPLPALLKPVLTRESINYLTQGTIYAKDNGVDESKVESKTQISSLCIKLTDFMLTKIYHEMIDLESRSQLENFMNDVV